MNVLEIPVTARPQTFTIVLAGTLYTIRLWWLKAAACWVFDISDQAGAPLLCGTPLVPGTDLISQFQYILAGRMFVLTDHAIPDEVPDWTHLGVTGHVYFRPPEAAPDLWWTEAARGTAVFIPGAPGVTLPTQGPPGPQGEPGPPGLPGTAATIDVGRVTGTPFPGPPRVTNVGSPAAARFDFVIPEGERGPPGAPGEPGAGDGRDDGVY